MCDRIKTMNLELEKLNSEQKKAITYGNGPVLIVAGAGTGKTTVITKRIAYLIEENKAKPEEILAMTFTDKAAEEMEERVDKLLASSYADLWISTFHSFCQRVLEEYGLDIGLPTNFRLLDDTASWLLTRRNLGKFKLNYYKPLGNPTKFIHALISHFSRSKDQAIFPEEYLKYAEDDKSEEAERIKEVALAYQTYQQLLLENNVLDFGDLINYCLQLFEKRPTILEKYQKKFKYILVDEFQDTNFAQYKLIKLISQPQNNLTVCADDDQAIYRFRGASFGNIVQFQKDFPEAKKIFLVQNYRSTQNILDLAHKFIETNNPNRLEFLEKISKKLIANTKEKGTIEHLHFVTSEHELQGVTNKIIEILEKDKEANFNDFAILARSNEVANNFSKALERANLPYQFVALKGLYSKPVILDIVSYLKLLDNYHENSAAYRIVTLPFLKISLEDVSKIINHSRKKSQSIYQSLKELDLISGIAEETKKQSIFLLSLVKKHTALANEKNISEVFIAFLKDSGYLEYLTKKEDKQSFDFINQFYDKIKAFEQNNLESRLKNFEEEIEMELEAGEEGKLSFDIEQGPEVIKIMTVHSAKGLEFKYVFLVNLVDKRFPTIGKKEPIEIPEGLIKDIIPEGDLHLEEERRLFYVAATRAKQGLFFTSAQDYGGERKKKLSRFLNELDYQESKALIPKKEWQKERTEINQKTVLALPNYFSFTQLKAFENCPLQYKFAHILRVPVRSKFVFSYGRTMHDALYETVKKLKEEKASFADILKIYKEKWVDEWYDSQEQKKQYYQLGEKSLEKFYEIFREKNPEILVINDQLALEQNFNLKINEETLIGKIDRIDKIGEGVELIDYKTGSVKEKLDSEDREQLLLYQIAAEEVFGLKPEKLTYYYLDEGKEISFIGSEKDKEKQKQKIISQIEKIKTSDFKSTPGWQCQFCDFKDICEYAQK